MAKEEKEMSFLDHLEEMRSRLIRSLIIVVIVATVVFILKDFVFDVIIFGPRNTDFITFRVWCELGQWLGMDRKLCVDEIPYEMQSTTMLGQFTAHLIVSLIGGAIIAFPFIFREIWAFIKPGLKQKEASVVTGVTFFTSLLFFLGVLFGYFVIVPLSLQFLGSYQVGDVQTDVTITSYMKLIMSITLASGIMFLLPILVYFFTKVGLVTPQILKKFRKHALVVVLIVAAIITPPDVTSQILVAFPVLLLYELSILISKRVIKNRKDP
jgi:sec-independent protein translocase protein TatC